MANKLYEETNIQAIANAIRNKGQTGTFKVSEMANAIGNIQTGIAPESYEWQQTTTPVQRYLDEVDYTDVPYTSSQIATYTALGSGERPVGKTITTQAGTLERNGYKLSVSSGNTTLYNDIPQKKTEFSVFNTTVKQVGQLKPTKPLRQIQCTTHNVRDLGGWQCDGGTIKYGKLFRGAEVSSSADLDIFLNQLGIRAELELQGEEGSQVLVLSNEVDYCCPIKQGDIYWANYTLVNTSQMKEAFRFIFESIKRNHTLYFHCTYGNDRTGTIACLIESLLGVSESDIDKDYELSSFYQLRQRSGQNWINLINQINALEGSTRQQKVANYLATMGFTEDEINEFVEEMVDGTPTHIDIDIDTYTITNNLSHATSDSSATSIPQYQTYEANIEPDSNYVINSVQILMGGVNITNQVWSGIETVLNRGVENTLSNCSTNNTKSVVIDGEGYGATLTADEDYTFDGATVQILMNDIDITDQVWLVDKEEY